jgi:RNA recognition motif-containing protein
VDEDECPNYEADAKVVPEFIPAFKFDDFSDSISDASTSAGPSPSLEDMRSPLPCKSLPFTPEHRLTPSSELEKSFDPSMSPEESSSPEKAKWAQARKIFVGGIPQSMDQNSLYKLFTKTAKVKKAWLQMFHADSPEGQGPNKRHRGFGFVIFADKDGVDQLLGAEFSKVIYFGDIRLDIKRAVGKTGTSPEAMPKTPGLVRQGGCETTPPILKLSTALQDKPLQISLATQFGDMPSVPPFPCSQSSQVAWQYHTTWTVAMPVQQVPSQPHPNLHDSINKNVSSFLLDGFVGPKPRNEQELEKMLLQAMPVCYDD